MVKLGVNVDHIAAARQARLGFLPDPVYFALLAERCGANGITAHLREDRRHIQDEDVRRLRKKIKTKLNLEMAITRAMVQFACATKVDDVCLVPEKRQELTTEGGLDVAGQRVKIKSAIDTLKKSGIYTSIFVAPDLKQIVAAHAAGADCVELHTGTYADAKSSEERKREFKKLLLAGRCARDLGLILNAGHGLDYKNVGPVAKIAGMNELNIGYSIVLRSLEVGFENAVKEMKKLI